MVIDNQNTDISASQPSILRASFRHAGREWDIDLRHDKQQGWYIHSIEEEGGHTFVFPDAPRHQSGYELIGEVIRRLCWLADQGMEHDSDN